MARLQRLYYFGCITQPLTFAGLDNRHDGGAHLLWKAMQHIVEREALFLIIEAFVIQITAHLAHKQGHLHSV